MPARGVAVASTAWPLDQRAASQTNACGVSRTALLFLNGLEVIDQGQDPSDRAGFIDAFAPFRLAKHLAPNRHVAGPVPLHLLTAVDDPMHLPEWELTLVLFASLR